MFGRFDNNYLKNNDFLPPLATVGLMEVEKVRPNLAFSRRSGISGRDAAVRWRAALTIRTIRSVKRASNGLRPLVAFPHYARAWLAERGRG